MYGIIDHVVNEQNNDTTSGKMIISHRHKFIFVKTLKTAGTSLEIFLSQRCGLEDIITPIYPQEYDHVPRNYMGKDGTAMFYNHISAYKIKEKTPTRIWYQYYKFCFERNPWDKTISHYSMLNNERDNLLSFDDYILNKKFCLNYPLYTHPTDHSLLVDTVYKYENLDEDLQKICIKLNISNSDKLNIYAKANHRKNRKPYQYFFSGANQKYIEVIKEAFAQEIAMHNYIF